MYTHWWIIPNQSNFFWGKQKSVRKMISSKYNFSFLSLVLCTLTDNFVVQKNFHEKICKKNFSWNIIFNYFYLSSVPRWYFLPNLSKIWSFWKWFSVKKRKEVLNMIFVFRLRSSVPPLITVSFKKLLHENAFSWTVFFVENTFFTVFLSNPFNKFYQTNQNTFFMKLILYD